MNGRGRRRGLPTSATCACHCAVAAEVRMCAGANWILAGLRSDPQPGYVRRCGHSRAKLASGSALVPLGHGATKANAHSPWPMGPAGTNACAHGCAPGDLSAAQAAANLPAGARPDAAAGCAPCGPSCGRLQGQCRHRSPAIHWFKGTAGLGANFEREHACLLSY